MSKFLGYEACPKCQESGRDSKGDNAGVWSDGSKHCFANCGYHVFPKHYVRSVFEEVRTEDKEKLPHDFSREIPTRAWQWLLQYGLSYRYWQKYCGYSEADQRLIITVGEPLDFSLGRDVAVPVEGEKPRRKWYCYGDSHKRSHVFGDIGSARSIICVEDVISAHKIGQAGLTAIPLFGTNVHDCHMRTLLHLGLPVVMWLDKDQEHLAIKRATRLSSIIGKPVRNVFTEQDPKCLSFRTINEVVNDI